MDTSEVYREIIVQSALITAALLLGLSEVRRTPVLVAMHDYRGVVVATCLTIACVVAVWICGRALFAIAAPGYAKAVVVALTYFFVVKFWKRLGFD